jgi:putative intracellular protease/amidase
LAGSPVLRDQVARFWAAGKPVGAICHGVLVLARTRRRRRAKRPARPADYLPA